MLQSQPTCSFSSRFLIAAPSSGLVWLEKVMNNTELVSETHVRISTPFFSDARFELPPGFPGVFEIDSLHNELAKASPEASASFNNAVSLRPHIALQFATSPWYSMAARCSHHQASRLR